MPNRYKNYQPEKQYQMNKEEKDALIYLRTYTLHNAIHDDHLNDEKLVRLTRFLFSSDFEKEYKTRFETSNSRSEFIDWFHKEYMRIVVSKHVQN